MREVVAIAADAPFVRLRRQRNLGSPRPELSRATAWMAMVGCLLTTQQKSGPGRPVKRLLDLCPFPLGYGPCASQSDIEGFSLDLLSQFGGIRRSITIAKQMASNFARLEQGQWSTLLEHASEVDAVHDAKRERVAARYIADTFDGFGPKQSRNLLQWLGVSKFEIPIDSRISKWLNRELLAFRLNANMLGDPSYYDLVSDGVIELCKAAEVSPCVFDAVVFSSFDEGGWSSVGLGSETLRGA